MPGGGNETHFHVGGDERFFFFCLFQPVSCYPTLLFVRLQFELHVRVLFDCPTIPRLHTQNFLSSQPFVWGRKWCKCRSSTQL